MPDKNSISLEIKVAKMEEHLKNLDTSVGEIKETLKEFIDKADDKYAPRESFIFWRNILVGGILVSIFLAVVALAIEKIL